MHSPVRTRAPAQMIGGVRCSALDRRPADKNRDYQRTLDEEQQRHDNYMHFAGISATGPAEHDLPQSLPEAFAHADGHLWHSALEEELLSLNSNQVYETVPIPEGIKPITSKPVFRIKLDQN
ncbi:hypothetical protein DFJ58DRAFT_657218, partial [Suillus subalutaceus]|uniref:uncharacterized protein n=1 Tax=Suillus subalutaceus TaxID=48586 RepID=UPI001B86FB06